MTGRLVWIADDLLLLPDDLLGSAVRTRWDAAPADPAEAIAGALREHEYPGGRPGPTGGRGRYSQAKSVLKALGLEVPNE